MKFIPEFSSETTENTSTFSYLAMKAIEKLPLPYTGNKKKLLPKIHSALIKNNVQFDTVLDAFTGSATVAFLFRLMGKKVIANDLLTSSYFNAVAFVENPGIKFTSEEKKYLLQHDNTNKGTFVEDNYLGLDYRKNGQVCRFNKFTLKECRYLDNFRANIDDLCDQHLRGLGMAANAAVVMRLPFGNVDQSSDIMKHRVRQKDNYGKGTENHDRRIGIYYDEELNLNFVKWFPKYVNDFSCSEANDANCAKIKRASFMVNVQQHVLRDCMVGGRMHAGQAINETSHRMKHQKNQLKSSYGNNGSTEMDFLTNSGQPGQGMKWWSFADTEFKGQGIATNCDVIELLKSGLQVDCVYYDPPYGGSSSDYAEIYRFLEEYVYSEELENLPHIAQYAQRFSKKTDYEQYFIEMLELSQHIPVWLFSYNDSSWKGIDYIKSLIEQFGRKVDLEILDDQYRYLYRKKQGRDTAKRSCEYLIIARK